MVRDIIGRRVKKNLSGFEQIYMEKFYIHNNKIYQIVRLKKYKKLNGYVVDVTYKRLNSNKVKSYTITLDGFENRKYYTFLGRARSQIDYTLI